MSNSVPDLGADLPPSGPVAMIRLAAAMAVQDAAAHMRNTQSVANAAIGAAQQMLLRGEAAAGAQDALTAAQNAVAAATTNYINVSAEAINILHHFSGDEDAELFPDSAEAG